MSIIGITGRKFNGKDTLGKMLIQLYNYTRLAFADPLKEACKCVFSFTNEQVYGNLKEVVDDYWHTTPRQVLQYVGTELFRDQLYKIMPHLGVNIWVEALLKKASDIKQENPNARIVVTDVRFSNEVEAIKKIGGIVIRVKRPSVNITTDPHPSEVAIDDLNVDYEIMNDGTVADLEDKLNNLMNSIS